MRGGRPQRADTSNGMERKGFPAWLRKLVPNAFSIKPPGDCRWPRGGADAEDADNDPVYDNPTAREAPQPAAEDNTRVLQVLAQLRRASPGGHSADEDDG